MNAISPLQMRNFQLLELHYSANTDFAEVDGNAVLRIKVRDRFTNEMQSEYVEENGHLPLDINIRTHWYEVDDESSDTPENEKVFRSFLFLDINTGEEVSRKSPYEILIGAFGDFMGTNIPQDENERAKILNVIKVNCAALLYGMLRSLVLQITQSSPYRAMILPSLSFSKIIAYEDEMVSEEESKS